MSEITDRLSRIHLFRDFCVRMDALQDRSRISQIYDEGSEQGRSVAGAFDVSIAFFKLVSIG